ncbi:CBS domain-containing protein [Kitasatospora griseola]|uniref:CBS domain-containing protein n=1 Tax=Kitasatospora griseola TaxID=2064 RepID=UPI0007C69961|nr:CBS domain-containing protein [Kitasatospora griseola]
MSRRTVHDVMTHDVVVAQPESTFKEILELFHRNDITAVPIVDERRHVLGIVSEADLIRKEAGLWDTEDHRAVLERLRHRERARAQAMTADGLMTSPVVTARSDWNIADAAKVMHRRKLKRLPVTGAEDMLVGIVSRCDLLQPFLRADREIGAEIVHDVLEKTLPQPANDLRSVHLTVHDGVVTLSGTVGRKSLIPIVERLCRTVDGVVDVRQSLAYATDDTLTDLTRPPAPDVSQPPGRATPPDPARTTEHP